MLIIAWGLANNQDRYKKYEKSTKHHSVQFTVSNLQGQQQSKSITSNNKKIQERSNYLLRS